MEINEKKIASLKSDTERIAKEQGQPITGYITEYSIFYMETGVKPMVSPRDSILYQYSSSSEFIEEVVEEELPSMKWTKKELVSYMDENGIKHFPRDSKKELLFKIENA